MRFGIFVLYTFAVWIVSGIMFWQLSGPKKMLDECELVFHQECKLTASPDVSEDE